MCDNFSLSEKTIRATKSKFVKIENNNFLGIQMFSMNSSDSYRLPQTRYHSQLIQLIFHHGELRPGVDSEESL